MRDKRTGKIGDPGLVITMIGNGHTANQIAAALGGINAETVRKFARKRGLTIERQIQLMGSHPAWKGGLTLDRSGYVLQRVPIDSEYGYLVRALAKRGDKPTDPNGYAPVHRITMHDMIGRKINNGEVVDHIDGDNQNNAPSNLRLFASNADHLRATLKGKRPNWTPQGFANMCKLRGPRQKAPRP